MHTSSLLLKCGGDGASKISQNLSPSFESAALARAGCPFWVLSIDRLKKSINPLFASHRIAHKWNQNERKNQQGTDKQQKEDFWSSVILKMPSLGFVNFEWMAARQSIVFAFKSSLNPHCYGLDGFVIASGCGIFLLQLPIVHHT